MDRKIQTLIAAGLVFTAVIAFVNIYAGGIVFVILAAVTMSLLIMQDSTNLPELVVELSDDAKEIIVRNTGNAPAMNIRVALVPQDLEYEIPSLEADSAHRYPLDRMIEEVKVVTRFENRDGNQFSRSFRLSSLGDSFEPLKPMIPLFRWK
jgi:hypothetical protein